MQQNSTLEASRSSGSSLTAGGRRCKARVVALVAAPPLRSDAASLGESGKSGGSRPEQASDRQSGRALEGGGAYVADSLCELHVKANSFPKKCTVGTDLGLRPVRRWRLGLLLDCSTHGHDAELDEK